MAERNLTLFITILTFLAFQLFAPALFAAPTSVTKTQDLNFGRIVGGSGYSGSVTIDTSGARSFTGSIMLLVTAFSSARFSITGNAGKTYILTLPAEITISSGTSQMAVTAITSSIPLTGVIPVSGALPFAVGGTLAVTSVQPNSTYNGNFTVSVK